ncbi:hypothetical protein BDQ17DRAFT_1401638 [Cyathus striatus]|nr:hypothetical protein BDQ17DRAFT_1401638 [Cyathus striatus]
MTTIVIPEGFTYVGASLMSTVFLLVGQSLVVSKYRKRAGIKYPQMYAEVADTKASKDALIFNCAQRAHQNTLENIPSIYVTTIIAGLRYPLYAALTCAAFTVSRIIYTRGYVSGDPAKRAGLAYRLSSIALLGSVGIATYTAGEWVVQGILKALA